MFKRIIVPLDGSEVAEQGLGKALELSKSLNAPLFLLRIVDTASITQLASAGGGAGSDFGLISEVLDEEQTDSKTYLEATISRLKGDGYDVSGEIAQGPIARTIVDAAKPEDVIVIGSHGRTGVQRWFLGSVAEDVIRHANCPVLLIRATHDETKS
ncbi:MAG TPA: universal stress protein [Thermomicrobiales bacterium]|nr:universal stress protein [Thermomicrobiales bacterium]